MTPKEQILKAIRNAIPSRGSKNELAKVNDEQLWQLFLKWRAGEPTASIAKWAHNQLNSERSVDSWNTSLKRFKKRIAHLLVALPLAGPPSPARSRGTVPPVAYDFAPTTDLARLEVQRLAQPRTGRLRRGPAPRGWR